MDRFSDIFSTLCSLWNPTYLLYLSHSLSLSLLSLAKEVWEIISSLQNSYIGRHCPFPVPYMVDCLLASTEVLSKTVRDGGYPINVATWPVRISEWIACANQSLLDIFFTLCSLWNPTYVLSLYISLGLAGSLWNSLCTTKFIHWSPLSYMACNVSDIISGRRTSFPRRLLSHSRQWLAYSRRWISDSRG